MCCRTGHGKSFEGGVIGDVPDSKDPELSTTLSLEGDDPPLETEKAVGMEGKIG